MRARPERVRLAIILSFVIALFLTMIPLPGWANLARPEWVAMALIYWSMAAPKHVGVGYAWVLGLIVDVIRGSLLGQYALALTLIAFIVNRFHQRLRFFPTWQQAVIVMFLVILELLIIAWIKGSLGYPPTSWLYWSPALSSMLLWPWLFILLRDLRRRYQ